MIREKSGLFLPLVFILSLVAGILLGSASDSLSAAVNSSAEAFINGYSYGAPLLIFLVLAPVLSRIFSTRQRGRFGFYVISWLAGTKILALLWAVLFTVAVFGLPVLPENSLSVGGALVQTSKSLLATLTDSQFFWAIYVAVGTGLMAIKIKPLANALEKGVTGVEYAGQFLQPLIPVLMFAVGVYIQSIPEQLESELGLEGAITSFDHLNILWFQIDANTTAGSLPESARRALTQFSLGYGDALLTYENEALHDIDNGKEYEIIVPHSTIYIQPKVLIVDRNVDEKERDVVRAFVSFLWSAEAQEALARAHFRVSDEAIMELYVDRYKGVDLPFTVDYLGGWEEATSTIIDETWRQVQREIK